MLAELAVHDRRQQIRAGTATRDRVERCRRLGDRLARAARELLSHRLDHLVGARDALQRLRDGLAEFGELATATRATRRRRQDNALAWQMGWQRSANRLRAGERTNG